LIASDSFVPRLREALAHDALDFSDVTSGSLGEPVVLATPRSAKGLEFDHVVLVEPAVVLGLVA
jgi:superfamily I DNA/RNA helicase